MVYEKINEENLWLLKNKKREDLSEKSKLYLILFIVKVIKN